MTASNTKSTLYNWQIHSQSQNLMTLQKTGGIIENAKEMFSFFFNELLVCRGTSNFQSISWFSLHHMQNVLFFPRQM